MAYSNFDFDKPAKIKDVGVLDQNLVVPGSLQRSNGRPSALVIWYIPTYIRISFSKFYVLICLLNRLQLVSDRIKTSYLKYTEDYHCYTLLN